MARWCARVGRLAAKNGGFWLGQWWTLITPSPGDHETGRRD
jgi:hypothetical protein